MTSKAAVYLGWWGLWGVTAVPAAVFNIFVFREPPMWPHLSSRATVAGTIIWLAVVLWIYALPVGLIITRRWWLAEKRLPDAQD